MCDVKYDINIIVPFTNKNIDWQHYEILILKLI